MANFGETTEVVNADLVELTDNSNSRDFGQLWNIQVTADSPSRPRYLTDGTRSTLTDLPTIRIEGDVDTTIGSGADLATMLTYLDRTNNDLPEQTWYVKFTAQDATTDTISIVGKVVGLRWSGPEMGDAFYHITIESTTGLIGEP